MKCTLITTMLAAVTSSVVAAGPSAPEDKPKAVQRGAIMIDSLHGELRNEQPKIKARQDRIDAELAALDRSNLADSDWAKDWAGTYYTGDGLGENVSIHIAPKAGISFFNYGCGGIYGGDHGDIVEALPDGLKLKLRFGDARKSFLSDRIYFVRWGKERFLVPDWQMLSLVNNYNKGGYARSEMFGIARFERAGQSAHPHLNEREQPIGRPELPEKFAKMLTDRPVKLEVTKAGALSTRVLTDSVISQCCTIEFDRGTDSNLYVGREFRYPTEITVPSGTIVITRADCCTCTGEFTAYTNADVKAKTPAVGETVLTGESQSAATQPVEKKGQE